MILPSHAKVFFAVPSGDKPKLLVLISQFKMFAWFVIASPTNVSAAVAACSKTLAVEA